MTPVSLDEMSQVKLMNRVDTKYVVPLRMLPVILQKAEGEYRVQEIDGKRIAEYDTLYYDTSSLDMYLKHHNKRLCRQKVRVRTYVDSALTFLEIKNKNNKGRTKKKRIPVTRHTSPADNVENVRNFMQRYCWYPQSELSPVLYTRFRRITLVNKAMTERLTIDLDLQWENVRTGVQCPLGDVAVMEIKRDGNVPSPMVAILHGLRLLPLRISKYCMGVVYTEPDVKKNRFLPKKRMINKMEKL